MITVHAACKLAREAYAPMPSSGKLVENRWTGARAVIGTNDRIAIASFRGSDSMQDWKSNLALGTKEFGGGRVHRGHLHQWLSVRHAVLDALNETACGEVLLLGHSSGAAISCIASMDDALKSFKVHVATFGAPPAGDAAFARAMKERTSSFIRVVHGNDIVPELPRLFGFVHGGNLIKLRSSQDSMLGRCAIADALRFTVSAVNDHNTSLYEKALEDCPLTI